MTIIEEIREELKAEPKIYSREELIELGIDPDLFVFISNPDFSNNPHTLWKYITENTGYKTVWLLKNNDVYMFLKGKGIDCVIRGSVEASEVLRRAHYIVHLHRSFVKKYEGQIVINLWHGSGIKTHDFGMDITALDVTKKYSEQDDLFCLQNNLDKFIIASLLYCDVRKMQVTGQPRLDCVKSAKGNENVIKVIPELEKYKKLILFAPTYRRTGNSNVGSYVKENVFGLPNFNGEILDKMLEEHEAAVIVKLHPVEEPNFKLQDISFGKHCYLLKHIDLLYADLQMNEVLNAFDVMIGDYSSLTYDYLVLDRPIIFNIVDKEEYSAKQGFTFHNIDYWMPGEKVFDFESLLSAIKESLENPSKHQKHRQEIIAQKYDFNDSGAAKRCLDAIENFKPVVNYGEQHFIKEKLLPIAKRYEEELTAICPGKYPPVILETPVVREHIRMRHLERAFLKRNIDFAEIKEKVYFMNSGMKHYLVKQNYTDLDVEKWNKFENIMRNEKIPIIVPHPRLLEIALEFRKDNVHLIEGGVDFDFFENSTGELPESMKEIAGQGKPIIGFAGTVRTSIYFSMVQYLCDYFKDYNFVFIGEKGNKYGFWDLYPNLFLLEPVEFEYMPQVIKAFSVCLIPYHGGGARQKIPVKLFEYLACGKPVVSSEMPNIAKFGVLQGTSIHEAAKQLEYAMKIKDDCEFIAKSKNFAKQYDWDLIVEKIINITKEPL